MGTVVAEITLKNAYDVMNAHRGIIGSADIHQTTVEAVVDTGAMTLIINDKLCRDLGLEILGTKETRMANNMKETIRVAETVEIHWKDRSMTCRPWVLSGTEDVLLGVIPLEDMDLIVDPARETLAGAHGDEPLGFIRSPRPIR